MVKHDAHKWKDCKCTVCGKIRNELHDWSKDCEKCTRCGTKRKNAHIWDASRCSTCGKTKVDEDIENLEWADTTLSGMLLIMNMAKYGEGEALKPKARELRDMYLAVRDRLAKVGSNEAKAALVKNSLSLECLKSLQVKF
jgi:hypothetical protein